ncbi:MAG TPA: protease modulator HflK [Phycisphaerae bacterium]|jgi:membrane protease subunit HflK
MSEELNTEEMPGTQGSRFAQAHHILLYFMGAALLVWIFSGFYSVGTDQVAIVERLGEFVKNSDGVAIQVEHGLHYHLPWPIDRVNIVSTQQNYTMKVDAFNASPAAYDNFKRDLLRDGGSPQVINALFDPYLITADKSVVHIEVNVQFRINDAAAWLTSVSHEYLQTYNPDQADDMRNQLFQQLAQRAMIRQVARMPLDMAVRDGRAALERNLKVGLQDATSINDPSDGTGKTKISLGVIINSVPIAESKVPDAVKPAYDNLITQAARAVTVKEKAKADAGGMVAMAEGEKSTLIADAHGYSFNTVQGAQGEADRFSQVLVQYNNAPDITRANVFTDALRTVTGNAKRIVFAQPGQRTLIVVDPPQYDASQVK